MKKLYLLFTLLLSMLGVTTMQAEDVTVHVSSKTGTWTSGSSTTWAKAWATDSDNPKVTIAITTGENNMAYWDTAKENIQFYNSTAYSGTSKTYRISVSSGWYIKAVNLDFFKWARPADVAGTSGHDVTGFVGICFDGETVFENESYDQAESVHAEVTDLEETYVDMVVSAANPGVFANTFNFYVTLGKLGEAETALGELLDVLEKYESVRFLTGEGPGNYGEAEVAAFETAIEEAHNSEGNPDMEDLPDDELAAAYRALAKAIEDAYEAVLASRNMVYTIPDGYYRIKTGLEYTNEVVVDEDPDTGEKITEPMQVDKYMLSAIEGETIYGRWGSLNETDPDNDCPSLWKITNKEDGIDFQNMATDARFNDVATSKSVTMKSTSENLMAIEPVGTVDGVTYANIRVSTQETGKNFYLHQGGHGGGSGKGSYLVGWSTSAGFNNDGEWTAGGSEWAFVPVDAATAEAIIKAYEPTKDEKLRSERYKLMLADAKEKLEIAKDVERIELIKDINQVSFVQTETSEGKEENILDYNPSTYWHSDWSNPDSYGRPSLTIELADPIEDFTWYIQRRASANDHVTKCDILAGNDVEDLAVIIPDQEIENASNGAKFETLINLGAPYKFVKFEFTETNLNTRKKDGAFIPDPQDETKNLVYAHFAEFHMLKILENPNAQYKVMGDVAKNLEDVITAQAEVDPSKVTPEEYNTLKAAYDAFIAKFVDPAELREMLASVEGISEGIVIGTQPGYWKDATTGNTLKSTVEAAQAYDKAGAYTQEQSDKYVADLKAQADAVYAAAIQIQENKWYRIRFASEEDFEAHEWNKANGYVAPEEGKEEINAPLFGKYVTVANYVETDKETGSYDLEMFDEDMSFFGENLFFMADEDITKKDMSMFRFIAVGDSAYLLQNKATGLFLKAAGGSGYVRLNLQPSVFTTKAVGYGLNVIGSKNVINGANENYLHGQKSYNILVTWGVSEAGSASAMYIEEAGDVTAPNEGEDFNVSVLPGAINTYCYPVSVSAEKGMYSVAVEENKISLFPITEAVPGRPFILILDELEDYNAEDVENEEAYELVSLKHGFTVGALEPQTSESLKGTFSTVTLDRGEVYAKGNTFVVNTVSKNNPITNDRTTVGPNKAYISTDPLFTADAKLEVEIDTTMPDAIQTALQNVSKSGIIYTLDGRVAGKGNLNSVKGLGRGIYILNGIKVVVK